jgi:hypothetical protein
VAQHTLARLDRTLTRLGYTLAQPNRTTARLSRSAARFGRTLAEPSPKPARLDHTLARPSIRWRALVVRPRVGCAARLGRTPAQSIHTQARLSRRTDD